MRAILFFYLILFFKDVIAVYVSYGWDSLCDGWDSITMRDWSFRNIQLVSNAPPEEEVPWKRG